MSDKQDNANTIDDLENGNATDPNQDGGLQAVLAAKEDECKALSEKYLRQAAEFENYKRLAQRDQREQIKFGNEQLLQELLPVVDNLERAIKAAHDNKGSAALVQGVDLTLKQLTSSLSKFGVQAVDSIGKPFDPSAHQAVSQVPSDRVPSGHVVDEFQKGYRLHDRILRAAMVSVSSGPAQADS
ncbi:MAG: nucleotide exchange factor GrpE [Nitrospira sp.]|nr:nucleotide exchange factor GrpE [Nitrospira sp.]